MSHKYSRYNEQLQGVSTHRIDRHEDYWHVTRSHHSRPDAAQHRSSNSSGGPRGHGDRVDEVLPDGRDVSAGGSCASTKRISTVAPHSRTRSTSRVSARFASFAASWFGVGSTTLRGYEVQFGRVTKREQVGHLPKATSAIRRPGRGQCWSLRADATAPGALIVARAQLSQRTDCTSPERPSPTVHDTRCGHARQLVRQRAQVITHTPSLEHTEGGSNGSLDRGPDPHVAA
jgi:hypothetical protein